MPIRVPAVVVAAFVLGVASGAQAKGPGSGFTVCGANGCVSVKDPTATQKLPLLGPQEGASVVGPAAPAPFYRVRLGVGDALYAPEAAYYVPTARVLRLKDPAYAEWLSIPPAGVEVLQQATATLQPYAVPPFTTVFVDEELARSPATYLKLFEVGRSVSSWSGAGGWLSTLLLSKRPSPWGDGANDVWVSRHASFLRRDGEVVRIPGSMAQRIRQRLPLS